MPVPAYRVVRRRWEAHARHLQAFHDCTRSSAACWEADSAACGGDAPLAAVAAVDTHTTVEEYSNESVTVRK